MICKACALGADLITYMYEQDASEFTGDNGYRHTDFTNVARYLHRACKGCDCAHHIKVLTPKGSTTTELAVPS